MKIILLRWLRHFDNTANLRRFWSITTNHYSTSKIEIEIVSDDWSYIISLASKMIVLLWYSLHVRQMTINIKVMMRRLANWRYLMHLVALICFAWVAYQARRVSSHHCLWSNQTKHPKIAVLGQNVSGSVLRPFRYGFAVVICIICS